MANYFLASVGTVEAFDVHGATPTLAFVSKTATESSVNTTISKEDIRGGEGAPIQFSFYHDPNVEITLTDIVFKEEYVAGQLGATFKGNQPDYYTETIAKEETIHTLKAAPMAFAAACTCVNAAEPVLWYRDNCTGDWTVITATGDAKMSFSGTMLTIKTPGVYEIRYRGAGLAHAAKISQIIIPKEYFLLITVPLFAGDGCSASNGKKAGHVTYEIPRFRMTGSLNLSHAMSSNATLSISGLAYANNDGNLFTFNVSYDGTDFGTNLKSIAILPDMLTTASKLPLQLSVLGIYKDGTVGAISATNIAWTGVNCTVGAATGNLSAIANAGSVSVTVNNGSAAWTDTNEIVAA